ncbi:MAG: hypothetical protein Q7S31_02055 [bacterium]|nr:hypothetical protein [bacterium]
MKFKPGQILLELVLALGISLIALMAIVQVTTKSITTAGFSKNKTEATTYAVAGMEWLRQQKRVLGWPAFAGKSPNTYCLKDLPELWPGAGDCSADDFIPGTMYQRKVDLTTNVGQVQAVVTVTWQEAIGKTVNTFTSKQTSLFTRY